jgi:hypothetical protein
MSQCSRNVDKRIIRRDAADQLASAVLPCKQGGYLYKQNN